MTNPTTLLLVHDSGQGDWTWRQVGRRLRAHDHPIPAPTLVVLQRAG